MLIIAALIWGAAFVAQKDGIDYMPPITFNSVRCLIGGIVLLPVVAIFGRKKNKKSVDELVPQHLPAGSDPSVGAEVSSAAAADALVELSATSTKNTPESAAGIDTVIAAAKRERRVLWAGGILCGIMLFAASNLQQLGLVHTTAGKAGFITTLYIVIVPAMGLFFKRRAPFSVWLGAALAVVGLYMLTVRENMTVNSGDLLVLISSFCFAAHIMLISYFSPRCDGVKLSCIQFFIAGTLGFIPMLVLEHPTPQAILAGWLPLLYAGVMSCGVAYTLQIIAQRYVKETLASLLMSLESVFSVLTGWILLNEKLTAPELVGCALIFAAVLLAQLPPRAKRISLKK